MVGLLPANPPQTAAVPKVALRFEVLGLDEVRGVCEAQDLERLGAELVKLTRAFVRQLDSVRWHDQGLTIELHDAGLATAQIVARRIRERLPGAVDVSGYLVPIEVTTNVRKL